MARDDRMEPRRPRVQIEFLDDMQNVEPCAINYEHFCVGNVYGPVALVVVAADHSNWSKRAKTLKNCWVANITSVNDVVAPGKRVERLLTQQAMSVRDD